MKNHKEKNELWVGYYKKSTGKKSITWQESVDEALCFGWIDGIRKSIDHEKYKIRFTPRRKRSIWSDVNVLRMRELMKSGKVMQSGLDAFSQLDEQKSRVYSFEQNSAALSKKYKDELKKNKKAWRFFENLPPSAKKNSIWYIMSAKKEETREKRLRLLIQYSAEGKRLPQLQVSREEKK